MNVAGLRLEADIASLKRAVTVLPMATAVAPFHGVAELTIGAVVSTGGTEATAKLTMLLSSVTAAVRANSRPSTEAPLFAVIDASARMLPLNTELTPSVAELPTCQ